MKLTYFLGTTGVNKEEIQKQAEKIEELTKPGFWESIQWRSLVRPVAIGLVSFLIGYYVIKLISYFLHKSLKRHKVNEGLSHFLIVGLKVILYFFLITMIAGTLGFKTSSLVAFIGTLGIAIGLALQGSLSDLASGILLVLLQPIKVGDYIYIKEVEGLCQVHEIRFFQTVLVNYKGFHYILPNKVMISSTITNLSNEPLVGAQVEVAVDYREDIHRVEEVGRKALGTVDLLHHERGYGIFVNELLDYGMTFVFRGYVPDRDYANACTEIAVAIKNAFDKENIRLAHQRVILEERKEEK